MRICILLFVTTIKSSKLMTDPTLSIRGYGDLANCGEAGWGSKIFTTWPISGGPGGNFAEGIAPNGLVYELPLKRGANQFTFEYRTL